jgi:hypothetical protein
MKSKNNRLYQITLLITLIVFTSSIVAWKHADDPRVTKIINQLSYFRTKYKQQKVYLHTDKDIYLAGETIWMKAYLMDGSTFQPDTLSEDIYVELIDANNRPAKIIILSNKGGFAKGNILLSDSLIDGNYLLRAYTSWMKNFDESFFYHKTIQVKNPGYENLINANRLQNIKDYNQQLKRQARQVTLNFFPEGGYLVAGIKNRLAFKAENGLGLGVDLTGTIIEGNGTQVANFQSAHLGMGSVDFIPQAGKKYTARVDFNNGENGQYVLPMALDRGITMTVDPLGENSIKVVIQANQVSETSSLNEFILVCQAREMVLYMSKGEISDKPIIANIAKSLFPAGVAQITLFDGTGQPFCERLVFIDSKIETGANKVSLISQTNGKDVICQVKVTGADGSPVQGNFSLSVNEVKANIGNDPWKENILSNLLLSSDIRGKVENPLYYFDPANKDAARHLDLVMLTNGWRRFIWKDLLAGKFPAIYYSSTSGITLGNYVSSVNQNSFVQDEALKIQAYQAPLNELYSKEKLRINTTRQYPQNERQTGNKVGRLVVVKEDDYSYPNMIQFIKSHFGIVEVSDNGSMHIRGVSSLNSGTDPLVVRDNATIDQGQLLNIPPNEIQSVEVITGVESSQYGSRGANGVIVLTSKKLEEAVMGAGVNLNKPEPCIVKEFYVPAYSEWKYKPVDYLVPVTLFWAPYLNTDANGMATVRFDNKLGLERFSINLEGITENGEIVSFLEQEE